jgi:hypothetical protein
LGRGSAWGKYPRPDKKEARENLKEALSLVLSAREKYFKKELGKTRVYKEDLVLA